MLTAAEAAIAVIAANATTTATARLTMALASCLPTLEEGEEEASMVDTEVEGAVARGTRAAVAGSGGTADTTLTTGTGIAAIPTTAGSAVTEGGEGVAVVATTAAAEVSAPAATAAAAIRWEEETRPLHRWHPPQTPGEWEVVAEAAALEVRYWAGWAWAEATAVLEHGTATTHRETAGGRKREEIFFPFFFFFFFFFPYIHSHLFRFPRARLLQCPSQSLNTHVPSFQLE